MQKLLGGHAETSVTLQLLKIMKFLTACQLSKKHGINVENL